MKSLLLYDFVGLYLAIRCNPYYGYPIASKMKILAMAVASTFVGHRKYLRLGFMNTDFSLPGNIHTYSDAGVRAQWDAFLTHLAQQVVHADE